MPHLATILDVLCRRAQQSPNASDCGPGTTELTTSCSYLHQRTGEYREQHRRHRQITRRDRIAGQGAPSEADQDSGRCRAKERDPGPKGGDITLC